MTDLSRDMTLLASYEDARRYVAEEFHRSFVIMVRHPAPNGDPDWYPRT